MADLAGPGVDAPGLFYLSLESGLWMSRIMAVTQTVAVPLAFWFKPMVVCLAMCWLLYRAYQVLNKPIEELAGLLGFDIPSTPMVDLACVKADGAIIHWSLAEKQRHRSTLKFEIHLNGALIDTLTFHETAATLTGLRPGSFNVVRVSLANNVEFSSKSAPIRFRTKLASSGDFFIHPSDSAETEHDSVHGPVPRIRPYRGLKDVSLASPEVISSVRETAIGPGPKRSLIGGSRPSRSALGLDKRDGPADAGEFSEGTETMQSLTGKLDAIRQEIEDAERLAKEEEDEELRQKDELVKERDELKADVVERDRAIRNIKREVFLSERLNTNAQAERSKHDRLLQQKLLERQKAKDDLVRWILETEELKIETRHIGQEMDEFLQQAEQDKETLRVRQVEASTSIRTLDDEAREKNAEIKKLEREMKTSSPSGSETEPNMAQQLQQDVEEQRVWEVHQNLLQAQYGEAARKLEFAKQAHAEHLSYLETLRARRRQEEAARYASPPPTQERLHHRGESPRARRAQSGHSSSDSPRLASFPLNGSTSFAAGLNGTTSLFPSAPYLNFQNGMTIPGPTDLVEMADEDRDRLTGGAPMSPGAGAEFLPADLFIDGDNKPSSESVMPLPGLGALPGLPNLPGQAPVSHHQEHPGPSPASPVSVGSRPPSAFASPQASQQNLTVSSPENFIDPDRRSIRSTRSNRATSNAGAGSRFSGMFGIKQRSKTTPAPDGPALDKTLSRSMPRNDPGLPGLDPMNRKRNSSISEGNNWGFAPDGAYETGDAGASTAKRRPFNLFGKGKVDDWPSAFTSFGRRPTSPRPGSTHSSELPRPSLESGRWAVDNWPTADNGTGARSSPLAFGANWGPPGAQQSRIFGSRHPSRRPSAQYGASGPPEDIIEADDDDVDDEGRSDGEQEDDGSSHSALPYVHSHLPPIGTRPSESSPKTSSTHSGGDGQRLNPTATDFKAKTFFSTKKSRDKGKENVNHTTHPPLAPPSISSTSTSHDRGAGDYTDDSPPASRKSRDTRDARSFTTNESSVIESSGRNSTDLASMPSYPNSETPGGPGSGAFSILPGSSAGKESILSKLTRKSSSSKFSLPTFKRDKTAGNSSVSARNSGVEVPTTPTSAPFDDDGEGMLSVSVGSLRGDGSARDSRDGARNSLSGRNWSSVLKLGKKKPGPNETPSLSSVSGAASGTEDGEDAEEEEKD